MMQSTYKFVTDVTETFDGDGEKSISKINIKNQNQQLQVAEVANSVLAHLNGSIAPEFSFSNIFDKERNMLKGNNLYRE